MAGQEQEYKKLPGSGLMRGGSSFLALTRTRCSLWLGKSHLLQVESQGGYSESYKRFYFRDIQALVLRRTKTWFAVNVVFGTLAGLFALWATFTSDTAGKTALLIITGVWVTFLLLNGFFGPSCSCFLQTAVHREELPSLRRLRRARKVIANLLPLIAEAQGTVTREEAVVQFDALLQRLKFPAPVTIGRQFTTVVPVAKSYQSRMHQVFFGALLVDVLLCTLKMLVPSVVLVLLCLGFGVSLIALAAAAIVKQHDTDLKSSVGRLTWAAAIYLVARYFIGYNIMVAMISPGRLNGFDWEYITTVANAEPFQTPWLLVILIFSAVVSTVLALWGLLELRSHHRQKTASSTMPPPPPEVPPPPA